MRQKGFTLIELVIVIVILGIIAAVAIPKFVDLGRDARVAKVEAMAGALKETANMWHAACVIDGGACLTHGNLTKGGITAVLMFIGYPNAGDTLGAGQIDSLIDYTGFDVTLVPGTRTRFSVKGAPDSVNCSATYCEANNCKTGTFDVILVTSGC